jgi:hypothetical protein
LDQLLAAVDLQRHAGGLLEAVRRFSDVKRE